MAAVGKVPDPEVAARCRALGVKGFAHFARRYGRRITDLTVEAALALLDAEVDGQNAVLGERWKQAVAAPQRTKEERDEGMRELYAAQALRWREYLRRRDEDDGYGQSTESAEYGDADPQHRRDDRPVFGDPLPTRANSRARPAERLSVFSGMDGG
jgi:hypothetical protein